MFSAPGPTASHEPRQSNVSKRRIESTELIHRRPATSDDFGDDGINDDELAQASFDHLDFDHVDNYVDPASTVTRQHGIKSKSHKDVRKGNGCVDARKVDTAIGDEVHEPVQLANGKWACNHKCKNKDSCRHLCCKEGTEKPPKTKTTRVKSTPSSENPVPQSTGRPTPKGRSTQTKLQLNKLNRAVSACVEEIDLTQQEQKRRKTKHDISNELHKLHKLHENIQRNETPSSLHSIAHKKPKHCYSQGASHNFSLEDQPINELSHPLNDDDDDDDDEPQYDELQPRCLPQQSVLHDCALPCAADGSRYQGDVPRPYSASKVSDAFGDDDSLLGEAMIGLVDSQSLQAAFQEDNQIPRTLNYAHELDNKESGHRDKSQIDSSTAEETKNSGTEVISCVKYIPPKIPSYAQVSHFPDENNSSRPSLHDLKRQENSLTAQKQTRVQAEMELKSAAETKAVENVAEHSSCVVDSLDVPENRVFKGLILQEKSIPKEFLDLEPWIFKEFGDIVELVDE